MVTIKRMIRKGEKPLQQLARRISEIEVAKEESEVTSDVTNSSTKVNLEQLHFNGPLTRETQSGVEQFKKFKNEAFKINCNNSKDACVLLKDGNFTVIENILKLKSGNICFIGKKYSPIDDLYKNPNSSLFNISIAKNVSSESKLFNMEDIHTKTWKVPCKRGIIVIPLAHNP